MLRVNNLVGFGVGGGGGGISLVGTAAGSGTLSLPAGLVENDVVIVTASANSSEPSAPAGWTLIKSDRAGVGTGTYRKVMGSSPDASVSFASTDAVTAMAFRGVDTSTPEDVTAGFSRKTGTGPGPADPASVTTITDGCAIVLTLGLDDHDEAGSVTEPSGFGDLVASDSSSEVVTSAMCWFLQESAGTIDPDAWGVSIDANQCSTIALRPA